MTEHDSEFDTPLASLVRAAAASAFDDGFTGRVVARLRERRETPLVTALERQFIRIVPLAAAATILLAAYNWWGAHATTTSAIDAALNLPQVTLTSAYSATSLFGAETASTETP